MIKLKTIKILKGKREMKGKKGVTGDKPIIVK
jgi:hypothetical protein